MKRLTCEVCGSTDLMKQDGVFVCQSCGCKYSVEEARKMMIEGGDEVAGSVVNTGNSDELANLYLLARRAKGDNNSENAQKYYEQIIVKDPSSWEANFYTTYYQSMNCKIGEIGLASARISNCEATVFNLIKEYVTDPAEQRAAVDEVAAKLISISSMLFNAYKNHYDGISSQIRYRYILEYMNNCNAARDIVYNGGDWIVKIFGAAYGDIAVSCWKRGNVLAQRQANAEIVQEYNKKIENIKQKRFAEYWASHVEEKTALETERATLNAQIKELNEELNGTDVSFDSLEESDAVKEIRGQLAALVKEKMAIGIFKTKERNAVQQKIDAARKELETALAVDERKREEEQQRLKEERQKIKEQIAACHSRIKKIETEMTKDR